MKISIIIPFKNSAQWLARCIESLLQEGDFEFIFVNDDSTDGGEDIIKQYADSRIQLLDNKHKKGVSGARNTGIDHATGDYITFADADDEMLPNAFEIMMSVLQEDHANVYQLNHYRYYTKIKKLSMKYMNYEGDYSASKLPRMWNAVWNKIISAEFIDGIRFNEKIQTGEDTMFILECLSKDNRIHHSNKATYKRRFDNPKSLSRIKTESDLFKYIRELESFIRKQKDPSIRIACCEMLARDWASPTYLKIIGHA